MEAIAVVKALTLAQDIGLSSLVLKGNSEIVINALKSKALSFASYGHLIKKAKGLAENFSTIHFFHIRRKSNFATHILAKHVSGLSMFLHILTL